MVYQYPEVRFPIPNRDTTPASAYDGFLPYLHSTRLRWSYGGLQGDPRADWAARAGERPLVEQAAFLAAVGFDGILVDRAALTTSPDELAEIAILGEPALKSTSGRWEYYELTPVDCSTTALRAMRDVALRPPFLYPGNGMDVAPGSFHARAPVRCESSPFAGVGGGK